MIEVTDTKSKFFIDVDDISAIRAFGNYSLVYSKGEEYLAGVNLSSMERKLGERFFRCHRCWLINMDKMAQVETAQNSGWQIRLNGLNEQVPIGRRRYKTFKGIITEEIKSVA